MVSCNIERQKLSFFRFWKLRSPRQRPSMVHKSPSSVSPRQGSQTRGTSHVISLSEASAPPTTADCVLQEQKGLFKGIVFWSKLEGPAALKRRFHHSFGSSTTMYQRVEVQTEGCLARPSLLDPTVAIFLVPLAFQQPTKGLHLFGVLCLFLWGNQPKKT